MQSEATTKGSPADPKARAALIAAGYRLCHSCKLADVTPELLATDCGLSVADFNASFGTLRDYFQVLQLNFLDALRGKIVQATMINAPGEERLRAATTAFLDGCLENRALRTWLLDLRGTEPEVQDGLAKRNKVYCQLLKIEFDSEGVAHAEAAAQLFFCMTQEASYAEHLAGKALPDIRETMFEFLNIPRASVPR